MTLPPAYENNSIPIVFAANDRFVPMFTACYQSMLEHISTEYNYDVVLISSDISEVNMAIILQMGSMYSNVSLRFYHPGQLLKNYSLKANAHISVETYYRFLIQSILPDYSKVLYLDCDTIITADLVDLYQTNVEGYMLAAVHDVDFLGQINGANPSTMKYAKEKLKMADPYSYFQAGILLFNEDEMRKAHSLNEWLSYASREYMYNDQDVLNIYCEGKVKFLDMSWNLLTDCDHYRVEHVINYAPDFIQKEYQEARKHPRIIHYAGFRKPWHNPTEDFAHEFWKYSRKTEYYEELLFRMIVGSDKKNMAVTANGYSDSQGKSKWINTIFPLGTKRRMWLDRLYVRIFHG